MSWRLRLSVESCGPSSPKESGSWRPLPLAETAVRDLLARPDDEFLKVAKTVVEENRELYERLR